MKRIVWRKFWGIPLSRVMPRRKLTSSLKPIHPPPSRHELAILSKAEAILKFGTGSLRRIFSSFITFSVAIELLKLILYKLAVTWYDHNESRIVSIEIFVVLVQNAYQRHHDTLSNDLAVVGWKEERILRNFWIFLVLTYPI